ncbi:MAG: hypothetical protein NXI24_09910 [bacterium]|nr:hypothetical protein [bacterium]
MTRFLLFVSRPHLSHVARAFAVLALCLVLVDSAGAARDDLPVGRWQARGSGLRLQILPKNQARLIGDRNTTAFEVSFAPEATVRREYWMGIKAIKSIEHKVKPLPDKKKEKTAENKKPAQKQSRPTGADASNPKAGEGETEAQKIPNDGPLRLAWLTPDSKLIVSFLIEQPPPKKKKPKSAPRKATKAQTQNSKSGAKPASDAKTGNQSESTKTEKPTAKDSPKAGDQKQVAVKPPKKEKARGPIPVLELLVFRDGKLIHEAIFERAR